MSTAPIIILIEFSILCVTQGHDLFDTVTDQFFKFITLAFHDAFDQLQSFSQRLIFNLQLEYFPVFFFAGSCDFFYVISEFCVGF